MITKSIFKQATPPVNNKKLTFPAIRVWKSDDEFNGGIVCFTDETHFFVLHCPTGPNSRNCSRYVGEYTYTGGISIKRKDFWKEVQGEVTISFM